jgi:uncharacterized protein (TIGR02246 family)
VNAQDEIQATLQATIAQLVDAWNTNDMSAFAALFTDDASYVSSIGVRLQGRQAIRDELRDNMASSSEQGRVILTDTSINLIKPDVAVVRNTWEMPHTAGPAGSRKGVITHVMVNDGASWRIAALQNTDVKAD